MAEERIGKLEDGREETIRMQQRNKEMENTKERIRDSMDPVKRSNRIF